MQVLKTFGIGEEIATYVEPFRSERKVYSVPILAAQDIPIKYVTQFGVQPVTFHIA